MRPGAREGTSTVQPVPWVEVVEPYAKPPKVPPVRPSTTWSAPIDLDRGWAELADVEVSRDQELDLTGCSELTVGDSRIDGIAFPADELEMEIRRSDLTGCDLSQTRITSLLNSRIAGCKLTGTDLSGATITDVEFTGCSLRYTNLRMAKLRRVRFVDCTLDEVDCFELQAEDLELPGTSLVQVNVDRLQATRVDLRTATELGLAGVGSLSGCLVDEHQLPALAYPLAHAVGIEIERPPGDRPS